MFQCNFLDHLVLVPNLELLVHCGLPFDLLALRLDFVFSLLLKHVHDGSHGVYDFVVDDNFVLQLVSPLLVITIVVLLVIIIQDLEVVVHVFDQAEN